MTNSFWNHAKLLSDENVESYIIRMYELKQENEHLEKALADEKRVSMQRKERLSALERRLVNGLKGHDEELQKMTDQLGMLEAQKKDLTLAMVRSTLTYLNI